MMKRFLYDAALLIILLLIGVSISDNEVTTTQDKITFFERQIEQGKPIKEPKESVALNTIEDNHASIWAHDISTFIQDAANVGVRAIKGIFDAIVEES